MSLSSFTLFGQETELNPKVLIDSYREEIIINTDGPVYLTGDYLRFSLLCLDQSSSLLSPLSKLAYVELLDQNNIPLAQEIIHLEEGKGAGDILLPFTASSGNYVLRAYTRWMRNFPPHGYSHKLVTIVNPFKSLGLRPSTNPEPTPLHSADGSLALTTNKESYSFREKVTAELALNGPNGQSTTGLVSVSVSRVPSFYREKSPATFSILSSGEEMKLQKDGLVFLPETKGQYFAATVLEAKSKQPVAGELIMLSIPGQLPEFFTSKSDDQGSIAFEIIDFWGSGTAYFQSANPESQIKIDLLPAFSTEYASLAIPALSIDESWSGYLTEASQNMQIRNVYTDVIPPLNIKQSTDTLPFYGIADQRYFLDDYTRFPLMEEVLREYVAGILLRKRGDGFYFKMVDLENNEIMENEPLMLYDGLPVSDADKIVEIDPSLVKRIDVISRRYLMGDAIFDGITSFHTYKGDIAGLNQSETDLTFPLKGVQPPRSYRFPSYETTEQSASPLPDFRNTLFWSPEVLVTNGKASIDFYTADISGDYLIEVTGISSEGQKIEVRRFFKVQK